MSEELNVWRRAREGYNSQTNPYPTSGMDAAAAAIRDYGDKRAGIARREGYTEGYQAAIADVVELLGERQRESLNGHVLAGAAYEITSRFGKGA